MYRHLYKDVKSQSECQPGARVASPVRAPHPRICSCGHSSGGAMRVAAVGLRCIAITMFCAASLGASAQTYPDRPIRLIVADSAGGAPDQLGRLVAQKMSVALGQQVVVDNRPGAGGVLGAEIAAKSPPDGYTLLMTTTAVYAILPNL